MSVPDIRSVQPCEMALLAELQAACFAALSSGLPPEGGDPGSYIGEPWSARSWAEVLAMPGSFALLAIDGEEPVGFLAAQVLFESGQLLSLGVLPSHQRAGCGRMLLERLLDVAERQGAESIQLEVAENNRGGRSFYKSLGFVIVGRRSGYYRGSDGAAIDALILSKSLVAA